MPDGAQATNPIRKAGRAFQRSVGARATVVAALVVACLALIDRLLGADREQFLIQQLAGLFESGEDIVADLAPAVGTAQEFLDPSRVFLHLGEGDA